MTRPARPPAFVDGVDAMWVSSCGRRDVDGVDFGGCRNVDDLFELWMRSYGWMSDVELWMSDSSYGCQDVDVELKATWMLSDSSCEGQKEKIYCKQLESSPLIR